MENELVTRHLAMVAIVFHSSEIDVMRKTSHLVHAFLLNQTWDLLAWSDPHRVILL